MKTHCSIAAVLALVVGMPFSGVADTGPGMISSPQFLSNGDLSISYRGTNGHNYAAEWTHNLTPPVTWRALVTNAADANGQVGFTYTPAGSQTFFRVHDMTSIVPIAIPLVYNVENTGANFPAPPLPPMADLPAIQVLPDPFAWANDPLDIGGTRSTNFSDWSHHRAEIKAQIENYEIGTKPAVDPSQVTASYSGGVAAGSTGTLTVHVTVNGKTLTLNCPVSIPSGATAPYPVTIGMATSYGSLNSSDFTSRGIASVVFNHDQVTVYNNPRNTDPYYTLYGPNLTVDSTGQYSAWSWGVSRIIDGLYLVTNTLPIDLNHICVTGCSYAGKMALFSGAEDERVALTIAQESGGGGDTSWRYSALQPAGTVEGLAQTSTQWFEKAMFQFGNDVSVLPEDHHELMAMCAPRALFCTANTDYLWLSNPSAYVCGEACAKTYETLGIGDRFGFNVDGGHTHCAFPSDQESAAHYFLDRFMLNNTNLSQSIRTYPSSYTNINYAGWSAWWGTTNPIFPVTSNSVMLTFESECGTVGANWVTLSDTNASNGKYVTAKPGAQSPTSPPIGTAAYVSIPFTLGASGTYNVFGRCNCPSSTNAAFWVRVDNSGAFTGLTNLATSGWQWMVFSNFNISAGQHAFNIGYRQNGAMLDKISISDSPFPPFEFGAPAQNLCP